MLGFDASIYHNPPGTGNLRRLFYCHGPLDEDTLQGYG